MSKIEGKAAKAHGGPGMLYGHWFVERMPEGKISINLPREMIVGKVSSIKFTIEYEEE